MQKFTVLSNYLNHVKTLFCIYVQYCKNYGLQSKKIKYKFQTKTANEKCKLKTLLTLSPVALLLPP
jgi:phage/plasmid-associated DNA primase